ncbi:MAG TPA: hypothetical protein PK428_01510, partial [Phycicoccus sp.]|nr:hypothetical protein [Phycicoccus sp.]
TTAEACESVARLTGERWSPTQAVTVTVPQRGDLDYQDLILLRRAQSGISGGFRVAGWDLTLRGRDVPPEPMTVRMMPRQPMIWEAPTPQAGVQFIGSTVAFGTSTAVPTHEEGDLLIAFASGDSIPSLPAGWTSLATNGAYPSRVAYQLAPSSSTASGTWTGATGLTILVYRGATAGAAAIHYSTESGPQTLPALNLSGTPSWVAGIGHWLTSPDSSPSGLTQRHAYEWGLWAAAWDTGGDVTSWSATQVGPTAAAWSWLAASIQLIPN